jgi:hypothetical protein
VEASIDASIGRRFTINKTRIEKKKKSKKRKSQPEVLGGQHHSVEDSRPVARFNGGMGCCNLRTAATSGTSANSSA